MDVIRIAGKKFGFLLAALVTILVCGALVADAAVHEHKEKTSLQKTCPVMIGEEIDRSIFSDYKGERIYLCCFECKAAFEKAPEQYLNNLPQFSPENDHGTHLHDHGFAWDRLVRPLGGVTLTLLLMTVCAGLFRRRSPKLLLKLHKILAALAVASGLCHAAIVFLFH